MSKKIAKRNLKKEALTFIILNVLALFFLLFFYAGYINFFVMLSKEDGGDLTWMYWTGLVIIINYFIFAVSFYLLSWFLKKYIPEKSTLKFTLPVLYVFVILIVFPLLLSSIFNFSLQYYLTSFSFTIEFSPLALSVTLLFISVKKYFRIKSAP